MPRVDACPLRGASERDENRDENGVREIARVLRNETQCPVKESLSNRKDQREAPRQAMGAHNVGNDKRAQGRTARK